MLCTKKNHIFDRLKNTVQSTVFFSPQVRRHKGFPKENLGAGGIHFRRASEMKRAPENRKIFWELRRHKSFPEENLGAGGIRFRRAGEKTDCKPAPREEDSSRGAGLLRSAQKGGSGIEFPTALSNERKRSWFLSPVSNLRSWKPRWLAWPHTGRRTYWASQNPRW